MAFIIYLCLEVKKGLSLVSDETAGGSGCSQETQTFSKRHIQQLISPQASNNMCTWTRSITFANFFFVLPVVFCPLRFDLTSEIIFTSRAALPLVYLWQTVCGVSYYWIRSNSSTCILYYMPCDLLYVYFSHACAVCTYVCMCSLLPALAFLSQLQPP